MRPARKDRPANNKPYAATPRLLPEKLKIVASGPCNPGTPKQISAARTTALAIAAPFRQFLNKALPIHAQIAINNGASQEKRLEFVLAPFVAAHFILMQAMIHEIHDCVLYKKGL